VPPLARHGALTRGVRAIDCDMSERSAVGESNGRARGEI